jgi:hypothetical protein
MPIPDFNHNGVLPPHMGLPTDPAQLSPYPVTAFEVCEKFGTSLERRNILRGWLELRAALRQFGFPSGFQWLDGSFMEDVEARRGSPPNDIDVVSFLPAGNPQIHNAALSSLLANRAGVKTRYKVDHLIVMLFWPGHVLIEQSRYWCGLFSHRRADGIWKGMLKVDLGPQADDDAAREHLESLELQSF